MKLRYLDIVLCRIKVRPEYHGAPAKPELFALNGREVTMMASEVMGDNGKYPCERMMICHTEETRDLLHPLKTSWLASGDLEVLQVLDRIAEDA